MESPTHSLSSLFEQLGLDNREASIEQFIETHSTIPGNVELQDANFWTPSQAAFLKQMKDEDADWVGIIDQLDVLLR